jgi:hypothetical protein
MIDFRNIPPNVVHPDSPQLISLPYLPRTWQREVHSGVKRFSVVVLHRRAGKTVLAVNTLISAALRFTGVEGRFAYIAPTYKQAKDIAWSYFKQYTALIPDMRYNESETSIIFPHNGARIKIYGADQPDTLKGMYLDGCVLDEVASMKRSTWGEVVRPMLADRMGWCMFIGTVKGINMFSELYQYACDHDDWYAVLKTCYETDALDPHEIELAKESMTEEQFRQEMLCDFNARTDTQLISMGEVELAQTRAYRSDEYSLAPRILGVDVARYGGDRSVIQRRQGLVAFPPTKFKQIDNMSLAARVAHECSTWQPDALFVDAGRGEGVIDRLIQLGFNPMGVDFGGKSGSPEYYNKRSEMWGKMAQWIRAGGALPKDSELMIDLTTPQVDFKHQSGAMRLESKDALRERGARSPDIADALALTFAFDVAPSRFVNTREAITYGAGMGSVGKSLHEYDPLDSSRW